jgi:Short repeat of unknown function (DUF308)
LRYVFDINGLLPILGPGCWAFSSQLRSAPPREIGHFWLQLASAVLAGILALVYPVVSSFAVVFLLGGLLIISGIAQGISLIDASDLLVRVIPRRMPLDFFAHCGAQDLGGSIE